MPDEPYPPHRPHPGAPPATRGDHRLVKRRRRTRLGDDHGIDRPGAEACLERAQQLQDTGHPTEALAAIRESLTHCPLAKAYVRLAHAALAEGDFAAALAAYQEAIRLDPYDMDEYLALGAAFQRAGLIDRALAVFHDRFADLIAYPPPTVAIPDPVVAFLSHLSTWRAKQICRHHLRSVIGDLRPATIWELLHVADEDRWGAWESIEYDPDGRAEMTFLRFLEFCWRVGYGAPYSDAGEEYEDDEIFWGEAVWRRFEDWVLQRPSTAD